MGEKGLENVRFVVDTVIEGALFFVTPEGGPPPPSRAGDTWHIDFSRSSRLLSPERGRGPLRSQCFAFEKVQTGTEQNVPFLAVVHVVHITQC